MPTFVGQIQDQRILLRAAVGPPQTDITMAPGFSALLDTGATTTCVSTRGIKKLELKPSGEFVRVMGATGVADAEQFEVTLGIGIAVGRAPIFMSGHCYVTHLPKIEPEKGGVDVLLGMDFLRELHLTTYGNTFHSQHLTRGRCPCEPGRGFPGVRAGTVVSCLNAWLWPPGRI